MINLAFYRILGGDFYFGQFEFRVLSGEGAMWFCRERMVFWECIRWELFDFGGCYFGLCGNSG